ncbi:hypothetical protein I4U23_003701 [Adineta vaga]|nr:hypothetical protein I4U23_003701 [Adineta vaga]
MSSFRISLIFLILPNLLIASVSGVSPTDLQNVGLDDMTSLSFEFSSILDKIQTIINQFHCPKEWTHFGGSCYYLSKLPSTSIQANQTCNLLDSTLMQIRRSNDFFYTTYVMKKHNLSTLMISIHPDLLKEKSMIETVEIDQNQFYVKSYELKKKLIDQLNEAGLRISKRSKKMKQTIKTLQQNLVSGSNNTIENSENDELALEDRSDEFKNITNIQRLCDEIHWNITKINSTLYLLTTSLTSNKIICSLNELPANIQYSYICENVFDFCFANTKCGKHGHCCEKISNYGKQIIISFILAFVLFGLSMTPARWVILFILTLTHYISSNYQTMYHTIQLVTLCKIIPYLPANSLLFCPIAFILIFSFSCLIKRQNHCLGLCHGRPGFLSPIEPFRITNRFPIAALFGVFAFEFLKTLETFLLQTRNQSNSKYCGLCFLLGFQYYPILISLQLRHTITRLVICLTKIGMGFDTPSFIIFTYVRNIPLFILLSYLAVELSVRFFYDSIYMTMKMKQNSCSTLSSCDESEELILAKEHVTKLFRQSGHDNRLIYSTSAIIDKLGDAKNENRLSYNCTDSFRFTTMILCTYTMAIVFVYYFACTFVFVYMSHVHRFLSLKSILISVVITLGIVGIQLYIGLINYKLHKLQLFRGTHTNIPSIINFQSNTIGSKSIPYFGFFVGYTACSFVIFFHSILFLYYIIQCIFSQTIYVTSILNRTVPILIIYLLAMLSTSFFGKTIHLTNLKIYGCFIYLSFFVECFLGFPSCLIRLITSAFFNVLYMARLDCSLYGKSFEKFDAGFTAYVSYLHAEVAYTNPIMLEPEEVYDYVRIKKRKRNRFRWLLAYTLSNNNQLIQLRKRVHIRLPSLRSDDWLEHSVEENETPEFVVTNSKQTKHTTSYYVDDSENIE